MLKGRIVEIKRFAIHDGDGIRTTVFFKGCPLKCVWCHNPESIDFQIQLAYFDKKCISCGECARVCPAHQMMDGVHSFARGECNGHGDCAKVCMGGALKLYGTEMTVDELLPQLLEDRAFYENSGGGVTLSGGECLMQADFCAELLRALKSNHIHTAVDTCGFVQRDALDKVMAFTDIFLYDIKAIDEDVHMRCTGQSNQRILENLAYIDSKNKDIEIRIPSVPHWNDDQIPQIHEYLSQFKNIKKIKILKYHDYAGSKYDALGIENTLPKRCH